MQNDTLVSVIVPVYNSEIYLDECIESILNQDFEKYEIIIVDDASTDGSYEIARTYMKKYPGIVKLYRLEKNSKQGAARNLGIERAMGRYVMFVDSDDVLEICAIRLMYEKAYKKDADIVFCDYIMCNGIDELYSQHVYMPYLGELNVKKKKALMTTSVVPWAKLIKRSLIIDNDIFFPEQTFYEDQATTYLYYAYAKNAYKIEKALYRYRIHNNSTTGKKNEERHYQQTKMAFLLIDRFCQRGLDRVYRDELDFFLIEQMYKLGIQYHLAKFDTPDEKYLDTLLNELIERCPEYYMNRYYIGYLPERDKKMLQLHRQGAEKLLAMMRDGSLDDYCPNYVGSIYHQQNRINTLVEYLKKCGLKCALWGAGRFARMILDYFMDYRFDYITDTNSNLWGTDYEGYVVSDYRDIEDVQIVIIEFSAYKHDIKNIICKIRNQCRIIDLELFIKHDLGNDIEAYMEDVC